MLLQHMHVFFLYIDPGSGGMIIQMLIGIAVTVGVFFRNIKYFFLNLFKRKDKSSSIEEEN